MRELRGRVSPFEVFGLGGDRLLSQDARLVAHVRELAVVGLVEVLRHLRRLRSVFRSVLREVGTEQEEAATTLGASKLQTFWRITLPAIRVGVAYGVVLTVARALGEFGAVIVVAGGVAGESQTLTLLVHSRYIDDHNIFGAYTASTMLMFLAIVTLVLMTVLQRKRA